MIQFVIGAIAGIAAKKYLTKERVEKIKETVIDISATKIKSHLDKFMYGDDRPVRSKRVKDHVFNSYGDALECLKHLDDQIKQNGYASVNDYYDTFDHLCTLQTYTDERRGWFNLYDVSIKKRDDNGWIIVLPEPVSIDQFTEGNPPCPKDVRHKNTEFDIEKNMPDISFSTKTEAKRAMWFAMGSIDDHKYISYYDLSTAFKPNKAEYIGSTEYGWTDKRSFSITQKVGDDKWYITMAKPTKIPVHLLCSENMRKD